MSRAKIEPLWSVKHTVDGASLDARVREHDGSGRIPCAFCHGDGEVCNPGNADPSVKVVDWLYPAICPRCGGTGKDPNHG